MATLELKFSPIRFEAIIAIMIPITNVNLMRESVKINRITLFCSSFNIYYHYISILILIIIKQQLIIYPKQTLYELIIRLHILLINALTFIISMNEIANNLMISDMLLIEARIDRLRKKNIIKACQNCLSQFDNRSE
jgi:hypothetical protein